MHYIPSYFGISELVPPSVHNERGEKAWELLDPLLLESIDAVRKMFGPMVINNWASGGDRQWSGLRTPDSPYYSKYSQHSFGRAADMLPQDADVNEIRSYIILNPAKFPLITGIELNVSWLHIDVRNTKGVKTFNP